MSEQALSKIDWAWLLVTLVCGLVSGGLQAHSWFVSRPLPTETVVLIGGPFGFVWLIGIMGCFLRFPLKALGVLIVTWPTLLGPYLMLTILVGCYAFGRCI